MVLILLTLVAIGLGYVIALAYWGTLLMLRPLLDPFKAKRHTRAKNEQVATVQAAHAVPIKLSAYCDTTDHELAINLTTTEKVFLQPYEKLGQDLTVYRSASAWPKGTSWAKPVFLRQDVRGGICVIARYPIKVRSVTEIHCIGQRRVLYPGSTVMAVTAKHHLREIKEFQKQRQALERPSFVSAQTKTLDSKIFESPAVSILNNPESIVTGEETLSQFFSGEQLPAWR